MLISAFQPRNVPELLRDWRGDALEFLRVSAPKLVVHIIIAVVLIYLVKLVTSRPSGTLFASTPPIVNVIPRPAPGPPSRMASLPLMKNDRAGFMTLTVSGALGSESLVTLTSPLIKLSGVAQWCRV